MALRHGQVTLNAAALAEGPAVEQFRGQTLTPDEVYTHALDTEKSRAVGYLDDLLNDEKTG